jgi:hypothetical protein
MPFRVSLWDSCFGVGPWAAAQLGTDPEVFRVPDQQPMAQSDLLGDACALGKTCCKNVGSVGFQATLQGCKVLNMIWPIVLNMSIVLGYMLPSKLTLTKNMCSEIVVSFSLGFVGSSPSL